MAGFLNTKIVSGDLVAVGSPAQIPCLLVCSPVAQAGVVFAFDPGDDVVASIGRGLAADALLYLLRTTNQRTIAAIAAATWTAAPSVTQLNAIGTTSPGPTSPTVTVALGPNIPGCLDDHNLIVRITTAGPLGTATGSIAYDGGPGVENFQLPTEGPSILRGTMDISLGASISGLTLVFTAPASKTLTFSTGTLAAAPAGLKAATATVASPVTLTTADLLPAGVSALAANPRRLTFTTAGVTASDAPASATIIGTFPDGTAATEILSLSQSAGSVTSVNTYATTTSIAYPAADGTGATIAIGYMDAMASAAEVVAAFNSLANAAPLAVQARAAQTALGTYLEIYSTSNGSSVTVTIDPTSTADTPALGFTSGANNLTATGTPATYPLPASGLVLTFPVGNYVLFESYVMTCVGPRASISALVAASTAARNQYATNPFGFLSAVQPADLPSNCATLVSSVETLRAAWLADANTPRDVYFIVGGTWHTASATAGTNTANITSNDNAMLTAFQGKPANPNSVAWDDVYIPGSASLVPGTFRRTAALAMACKRASVGFLAATVTEGTVPEASLLAGDGLTAARDQNTAVVHAEGLDGPGFFVLKGADDQGDVKFALGATRAGATSRLRHDGDFAVCAETARLVQNVVKAWEGQRPGLDPLSGQMADHDKGSRAGQVDDAIRPFLLPLTGQANCTDFGVTVTDPPAGKFQDNGLVPVKVNITTLGTVEKVDITIAASGVTSITPTAGA